MQKTTKIQCPHCAEVQSEDIIDLTEGDSLEGTFIHECENCDLEFTVVFEFVPHVKTY